MTDDGHFDAENKWILNLGEPTAANNAVSLHYVDKRCLLLPVKNGEGSGTVDVKGNKIGNADTSVDLKELTNKQYVDKTCVQFRKSNGVSDVIDAHVFRIVYLKYSLQPRDATNKRYVDANCLHTDEFGNVSLRNKRLMDVQDPVTSMDAVNLAYVRQKRSACRTAFITQTEGRFASWRTAKRTETRSTRDN